MKIKCNLDHEVLMDIAGVTCSNCCCFKG